MSAKLGTLETMLQNLGAPHDALVVMDAGIATEANIQWLRKTGYGYLVVSRERSRQFNADDAVSLVTASDETVRCQKGSRRRRARSSALLPFKRPRTKGTGHGGTFRQPL